MIFTKIIKHISQGDLNIGDKNRDEQSGIEEKRFETNRSWSLDCDRR
jgi:hypothetical protein